MMNRKIYLCLFWILATTSLLALGTSETLAWQTYWTNGRELKHNPANCVYYVNPSGGPSGSANAIASAMNTWNNASGHSFRFSYAGTTSYAGYDCCDGYNIVTFASLGNQDYAIARTFLYYNTVNGVITNCDIRFNTAYCLFSVGGSSTTYDVQNICTHELGHALGLADLYGSSDSEKTMYGYGSKGETKKRSLDPDDIAGIQHLYPILGNTPPLAPSNLSGNALSSSQIKLTWTDNSTNENGFYVYRWNESTFQYINTVSANIKTYQDNGLSPGITYYYNVAAYNSAGTSNPCSWIGVQTISSSDTKPNAPGNLRTTTMSSSEVGLYWTDNSNNEKGFNIYVYYDKEYKLSPMPAGTTSCRIYGLPSGKTFYFSVGAYNDSGENRTGWVAGSTRSSSTSYNLGDSAPTVLSVDGIGLSLTDDSNDESPLDVYPDSGNISNWPETDPAPAISSDCPIKNLPDDTDVISSVMINPDVTEFPLP